MIVSSVAAFGWKAMAWLDVTLAAMAVDHVWWGWFVSTVTRWQMSPSCGHFEEQEQHIELWATLDGKLIRDPGRQDSVNSTVRRLGLKPASALPLS